MDLMKVFDQAVREIKREVNIKVLKVPEIEQKVLDATSDEPWGPHGSDLLEIARATKKYAECQLIMSVLWTRLSKTETNWRHIYKALSVIEYLIANGSERAVDDILEHSFQISSLSEFEYVEPNGKDVGINVKKKVETILTLLNDKEKMQEVRNKATTNRDKYIGLSSRGITYKSNSSSYGSSGVQSSNFGGLSNTRERDLFKDSYKDNEAYGEETSQNHGQKNSHSLAKRGTSSDVQGNNSKGSVRNGRDKKSISASGNISSSQTTNATASAPEDDLDDFDPRGYSTSGMTVVKASQVDLFGDNLIDLMDAPPTQMETSVNSEILPSPEVDLFADATFVSAAPSAELDLQSQSSSTNKEVDVDHFSNEPAFPASFPSPIDFFSSSEVFVPTEPKPSASSLVDPFASVPLNNFEESDIFGDFTTHTGSISTKNAASGQLNEDQAVGSIPPPKKGTFKVKSNVWADSLSRGLIDLNISAPKKVSLADIGIVGGLGDGFDEKEKAPNPPSYMMGRATEHPFW